MRVTMDFFHSLLRMISLQQFSDSTYFLFRQRMTSWLRFIARCITWWRGSSPSISPETLILWFRDLLVFSCPQAPASPFEMLRTALLYGYERQCNFTQIGSLGFAYQYPSNIGILPSPGNVWFSPPMTWNPIDNWWRSGRGCWNFPRPLRLLLRSGWAPRRPVFSDDLMLTEEEFWIQTCDACRIPLRNSNTD